MSNGSINIGRSTTNGLRALRDARCASLQYSQRQILEGCGLSLRGGLEYVKYFKSGGYNITIQVDPALPRAVRKQACHTHVYIRGSTLGTRGTKRRSTCRGNLEAKTYTTGLEFPRFHIQLDVQAKVRGTTTTLLIHRQLRQDISRVHLPSLFQYITATCPLQVQQ